MSQENVEAVEREAGFPSWALLGLVCGACMLVLVILGMRLTFFNDDWYFLLQRPGLEGDSIFSPHNGQLVVLVDLSFKGLVALFGFAQLPFRLVLSAAVAALGIVVYLIVSKRAGRFLGLVATTIVVFLGPAWEDLLFYASIGPIAALVTGLAAVLVLEEDAPRKNAIACLLLVCAVSLSGVGLAFVVAAAIAVVLRRRPGQLWIPAVPAVLYGIWWLTDGTDASSALSLSNLEHLPKYMLDSASIGLASITGLNFGGANARYSMATCCWYSRWSRWACGCSEAVVRRAGSRSSSEPRSPSGRSLVSATSPGANPRPAATNSWMQPC